VANANHGNNGGTGSIYTLRATPAPQSNLSAADNVTSWIVPSLGFTLQQSPDLMNWTEAAAQRV
jgi:hypothetical protein